MASKQGRSGSIVKLNNGGGQYASSTGRIVQVAAGQGPRSVRYGATVANRSGGIVKVTPS